MIQDKIRVQLVVRNANVISGIAWPYLEGIMMSVGGETDPLCRPGETTRGRPGVLLVTLPAHDAASAP